MHFFDNVLLASLIGAASLVLAAGGLHRWARGLARLRAEQLRMYGLQLIHALTEYSAWIEHQRDLPFTRQSLEQLSAPAALSTARRLKRDHFPGLHLHLVSLLRAHGRIIEYFWQQNLLRLSQGHAWRPAHEDRQYQQLRDAQEDLIGQMIDLCREITGDSRRCWQRTGSDFGDGHSLPAVPEGGPRRVQP